MREMIETRLLLKRPGFLLFAAVAGNLFHPATRGLKIRAGKIKLRTMSGASL